ncbi:MULTISPECIES: cupin [Tatumella]|uniref:Cupin n=1 Tax=Tatumella punctata TaxID=399969 RepID=A0ABW1VJK8_9GAMM|nr:cupin [Tatumella sp. JGM16]MBS0877533.1 cupin [Tatumella sp. JGM82]MBS0891114.1 cupin [Tatumella sp. JGM94]MBS0893994.1 cupin [Tatumella sp. JGM130]MBS0902065.1 cupin [Tatumella sp. JGM100]MBS0913158.1 cupin [Tatumella sp. JGM91]
MNVIRSKDFHGNKAWEALPVTIFGETGVNPHSTDEACQWHINDGQEVFAVMDGIVDIHYKRDRQKKVITLYAGDIFYASEGTEHVAYPQGISRILVTEKQHSI